MKFMITLITAINLFTSPFLNNVSLRQNETFNISKIMNSIKSIFSISNDQKKKNNIITLYENKTNKMNIDDLIVTTLEIDDLSGFSWQYQVSEPGIIDIIFDNYIPGKGINNVPGKHTFIFKSLAKGKCQLTFHYYKQGENSAEKSIIYKISVK